MAINKDKLIRNSKDCTYWLVWFKNDKECCGSNAWYPIDGRLNITTIKDYIKESNVYKYKPKDANNYKLWKGTILNGHYITNNIFI